MRASKRAQVRQATRLIAANYRGYRGSSSPLCASTVAFRLLRHPLAKIRPSTRFQFRFQRLRIYCYVLFISRFIFYLSSVTLVRIFWDDVEGWKVALQ